MKLIGGIENDLFYRTRIGINIITWIATLFLVGFAYYNQRRDAILRKYI